MRANPACVVEGESAGGNDAMDMRMMLHDLIPGVQHAEEADVRAELPGIASGRIHELLTAVGRLLESNSLSMEATRSRFMRVLAPRRGPKRSLEQLFNLP